MSNIEEVTAGIDWATCTLSVDSPDDQIWLNGCLQCLDIITDEGYKLEMCSLNGYDGVKAGGSFVGTRRDGHMAQFSGRFADRFFSTVYRPDVHFSRLDVQVTVKFDEMPANIAKKGYRDAMRENEALPVQRRRKIYIIVGSDGGDTLYVGSTSSDARGRLYNKEVQSEDPVYAKTWRYEVMFRNDIAMRCISAIAARSSDRLVLCSEIVSQWYQARGVETPWQDTPSEILFPPKKTLPTDVEAKLNWLRHQVAPTIRYLTERGLGDKVAQALGLAGARGDEG